MLVIYGECTWKQEKILNVGEGTEMLVPLGKCRWLGIFDKVKCTMQIILTTKLNHLTSMAKWLSVCLWTKWWWVWVQLQSTVHVLCDASRVWYLNVEGFFKKSGSIKSKFDEFLFYGYKIDKLQGFIYCHVDFFWGGS